MRRATAEKLAIALLAVYFSAIVVNIGVRTCRYQWDFAAYYHAARAHAHGLDPYNNADLSRVAGVDVPFNFVYPPATLWAFRPFALLDYDLAARAFLTLKCLVFIGLLFIWTRRILPEVDVWFYVLCLLAFCSAIMIDFTAGNVTVFEQFLVWSAFAALLARKPILFCALIVLAALLKLTPILFLFVLLATDDPRRRRYLVFSLLGFFAILAATYALSPALFHGFLANAVALEERGVLNPSTLAAIKDLARSCATRAGLPMLMHLAWPIYAAVVVALIAVTWRAGARLRAAEMPDAERTQLFLACFLYALIMPRFKDYAYALLIPPTYYLLRRMSDLKAWPFLLFLLVLPFNQYVRLPGLTVIFEAIKAYYPLALAYLLWALYLRDLAHRSDTA